MTAPLDRPRAAASRADLVYLLAALPPAQWTAAARALGFAPVPPAPPPTPARITPPPTVTAGTGARGEAAAPYRPTDLPDLAFWRIAAERTQVPDAPEWLLQTEPLPSARFLSDPHCPRPAHPGLVSPARQARFLRRHLAAARPGAALDLDRLCRHLAERRLPARLPRRARPRWPARVDLVLDLSLPLRPFWEDFWHLEAGLCRLLGHRLRVWQTRGGDPADLVGTRDRRPGAPPAGEGALVFLSDAGLYAPGGGRHRRWQDLGRRLAGWPGAGPLLIAPVPARLAAAGWLPGLRLVPWDRGAPLHPLHPLRPSAAPRGLAGAPEAEPGTALLLAALAHASRVEPAHLRALRLALCDHGLDIGDEYRLWNHPQVRSNLLACTLDGEHRAAAALQFKRLPAALQRRIATLRHACNRHQSPLIQAEEVITDGPLAPAADLDWARGLAGGLAATLDRGDPAIGHELAGYVTHLAARRPEVFARDRRLAAAWVIARRDDLRRGTLEAIPAGVDLGTLGWLLERPGVPRPAYLAQIGAALGVFAAGQPQPVCRLAELDGGGDYWQVQIIDADAGGADDPAASALGPPRVLRLGDTLALDPATRYRLTIGRRQLDLEAVRRPPWAAGLGRDAAGLFAQLADGRRQYLDCPAWAVRHGVDQAGWWAEFALKGVVQRLRWLPPGEFLMGSPQDEPERYSDERPHAVVLSEGYWLADTACTQALWQAALGETPSHFKGPERPVEQVSWSDVVDRFLPALNAQVPGLDARLPTEAQWEHACRAGTTTPFSFGANMTPDQVNYDGNHPYAGGAKGRYRAQTVEVKALPANDWGLYQLHGNVWEWCADWLGDYADGVVVDPLGPPEGRERVLRGGCWISRAGSCRSAYRYGYEPGFRSVIVGFRLSRGSSPQPAGGVGVAGVVAGAGAPATALAAPAPGAAHGRS